MTVQEKRLIYDNKLTSKQDIEGFILEGQASITFPQGRMRMENKLDPALGQEANYVFWCPVQFPDHIQVEWDFYPIQEPGLSMIFFAASGRNQLDLFDSSLQLRAGVYGDYIRSDINTLHLSYFRRRYPEERAFHTCNLRKSHGFHLVAQGGDPIPNVEDCQSPYHMTLVKKGEQIQFFINELLVLEWEDDGISYGDALGSGKIGFRQMAPLIAEYANFKVFQLEE